MSENEIVEPEVVEPEEDYQIKYENLHRMYDKLVHDSSIATCMLKARIEELEDALDRARKGPPTHPMGEHGIQDLRSRDMPGVNKTCKCCSKRVPIAEIGSNPEFCVQCMSK